MTEVNNNRDNLINAIALTEDITRSSNRVHEMLTNLINNPGNLTNIKTSIDNLYDKIANLKKSDMKLPLVEEQEVVVPGIQDISPKQDVGYGIENALVQPTPELEEETEDVVEETPELEEETPELEEETPELELEEETMPELEPVAKIPPRKSPRRNDRKQRPNRPLSNRKRTPQPRKDNQ